MHTAIDQKHAALVAGGAPAHGHRLGRRRGLIEHRGVRHWQTGQVAHHGLKIEQGLQTTLRNFRLVGGIGGVPGRVFQHIAQHHRWRDGVVITHADAAAHHPVARS